MEGQYGTCDWDLIGSCWDCLTEHPGNWWVENAEDLTTCCVPFPEDLKFERSQDVNTTADCPEAKFIRGATTGAGVAGVAIGLGALGLLGLWIYRRFFKRRNQQQVVEPGGIELDILDGHQADEGLPGDGNPNNESVSGEEGDDEGSSRWTSEDEELNRLELQFDDLFAEEGDDDDNETAV